jgi:hypothetical protein
MRLCGFEIMIVSNRGVAEWGGGVCKTQAARHTDEPGLSLEVPSTPGRANGDGFPWVSVSSEGIGGRGRIELRLER